MRTHGRSDAPDRLEAAPRDGGDAGARVVAVFPTDRVTELRAVVARGEYRVDPTAVARKLLREVLADVLA
ncbi:MAG TPA: flagellar biosynthesis anti-sigma factor FlgM [Gaiellaceae bacterium]|nr:flagellar biosynthesis anti-sigma factor FlgM [Gaiellaceae bacterium]